MCLLVNDDLQKTFERVKALKKGSKPAKFIPGESVLKTELNPSHIYTKPAPQASSGSTEESKAPDNTIDLFDLLGGSSPS